MNERGVAFCDPLILKSEVNRIMKKWIVGIVTALILTAGLAYGFTIMGGGPGCIPYLGTDGKGHCDMSNFTYDAANNQMTYLGTNITASGQEISNASDISAMVETVATTNVITTAECGKTFFLNLAGGFTSTLPAPTAGCKFDFIVKTAPTTAYIIASNGGGDVIQIGTNELEVDTGDDGPYDDNADTVSFVANIAAVGDYLSCVSDGTLWYCNGQTNLDGGMTSSTT